MTYIYRNSCPVCNATSVDKIMAAEDYTVSHQLFEIWQCHACTLRFTQNAPDALSIGEFYQAASYISHTDTKKGLVNRLYHQVRKLTLKKKLQLVMACTGMQKGSLLDIGAGTGAFVHEAARAGWQASGLEPDADTRHRAMELHGMALQDAATLFQLTPASFDAITLWHVLEHVHELHAYMQQIKTLLKKEGCAFIAVPNYTAYDATVYGSSWAAYDVPRHLYHFSPKALKRLLEEQGLRLLGIRPMWYDSFYISMLSEQYHTGRSRPVSAFLVGLLSNLAACLNRKRCSSLIYIIGRADGLV